MSLISNVLCYGGQKKKETKNRFLRKNSKDWYTSSKMWAQEEIIQQWFVKMNLGEEIMCLLLEALSLRCLEAYVVSI